MIDRDTLDLAFEDGDRVGEGVVRARVEVTVLVVVAVVQRWRIGGDEPPLEPAPLDLGHVTDQAHDRQVARFDGGRTSLLVAEPVGLQRAAWRGSSRGTT